MFTFRIVVNPERSQSYLTLIHTYKTTGDEAHKNRDAMEAVLTKVEEYLYWKEKETSWQNNQLTTLSMGWRSTETRNLFEASGLRRPAKLTDLDTCS